MSIDDTVITKVPTEAMGAFYLEYFPPIWEYKAILMPKDITINNRCAIGAHIILPEENNLAIRLQDALQDANLVPAQFTHEGHTFEVQIRYLSQPQRNDRISCILCHEYGGRGR